MDTRGGDKRAQPKKAATGFCSIRTAQRVCRGFVGVSDTVLGNFSSRRFTKK